MKKKFNILVTNDDGIDSPGIYALAKSMEKIGNVTVVAPDRQQSAVGHALTVSKPLRVNKFYRNSHIFGYSVNGTPADCVKLAFCEILKDPVDLVVSGINHGQNTSINILYSGTVSGATEGMLRGIPSLALSLASYDLDFDCNPAAEYSRIIAEKIIGVDIPEGTFLNVNIPALSYEEIKGIRVTKHSKSIWDDKYEKRQDPFGRDYYWFSGRYKILDADSDSDDVAVQQGYISVNPVHYYFTNSKFIDKLKDIFV